MITNHATSPSKPTPTARMSLLLPPATLTKDANAPTNNDLIKGGGKDEAIKLSSPATLTEVTSKPSELSSTPHPAPSSSSFSPSTKQQQRGNPSSSTSSSARDNDDDDASCSNVPGYLRPKYERRARSKTPPPASSRTKPRTPIRGGGARNKSSLRIAKQGMEKKDETFKRNKQSSHTNQEKDEKKRIILSPKSQQRSERQNRPSFQGLSVIEGKRKTSGQNGQSTKNNIEKAKADRRRKSLNMMSSSAQSQQIKEMLESTIGGYDISAFVADGTPEDRLQAVMTKAKERGMNTESIFSFFNGGNPNTTSITKETFVEALEKLGDSFLVISDDELIELVKKFDHNRDGKISIDEFKHYCYQIPSVAWKAERTRLERSGELKKLQAQLSRRFTISDVGDGHNCGDEVYRTSKFFWKTNDNVDIRLFHCPSLNVTTVQLYNQTSEKELPSIYVCRNKIEYQIKNIEQEVDKLLQVDTTFDNQTLEEKREHATWEIISKYIVSRLKLKVHTEIAEEGEEVPELECAHISNEAPCVPFLCKLTGDTFDTLMIQKPLNLKPPPSIVPDRSSGNDFEGKMAAFRKDARKARASRKSAQGLEDLVSSALAEVETVIYDS